jgi:hypothetical protein
MTATMPPWASTSAIAARIRSSIWFVSVSTYQEPASETERALVAIWTELLGIERIGVNDDFFELGGHSLLATRVLARIDHTLHARLSLRDVFQAPTIRLLSEKVTAAGGAAGAPAPEGEREEVEF